MIGLPLGLLYANAVEWVVHRYLLHGLGKRKSSIFSFHWHKHHKNSRRHGMYDPDYEKPIYDWRSRGKELGGIGLIALVHVPLWSVAPWFTAAVCYSSANYLYRHEKSHIDVEWGKRHMRSHYDHHMGKNQDMNWCVTRPWFDWIMGTRERYVEPADLAEKRRVLAATAKAAGERRATANPAAIPNNVEPLPKTPRLSALAPSPDPELAEGHRTVPPAA